MVSAALLAGLVLAPVGAYLSVRFPDWYGMYQIPLSTWPQPEQLMAGVAPAAIAPLAALLAAALLRVRWINLAWALMALGAAGASAVLVWGADRLLWVGSREAFTGEARSLMPRLLEHRLLPATLLMLAGLATAWVSAAYTLRRQRRALRGNVRSDTVIPG